MTVIQMCRNRIHRDYGAWSGASHAGLLLSSYLQNDESEARRGLLDLACKAPAMARDVYSQAFTLLRESMPEDTMSEFVEVDGRAIVGLGAESPLETGLALHHTYGVPFIPASALKGLASHYCLQVWGECDSAFKRDGEHFLVLFGNTEDGGHIIFNDALITPESLADCLAIDVMTVHHPDYYKPDEHKPPSDFDDPNPIPFLSARGRFWVSLYCDVPGDSGKAWAHLAMTLLLEALGNWGIGAKTNAGYGRMRKPEEIVRQTIAGPNGGRRGQMPGMENRAPGPGGGRLGGPAPISRPKTTVRTGPAGARTPVGQGASGGAASGQWPCKAGDKVEATLSEEKTKKGGWKAIYEAGGRRWVGPIQNSPVVPADAKPGDAVKLIVKSINSQDIAFEWPKGV